HEAARAAVYAAGATLDDPLVGDVALAVASAKIVAGDAALKNARACIQIHGGMGYTWEIPAHYYLKRAWACENLFGTVDEHADRVAEGLGRRGWPPPPTRPAGPAARLTRPGIFNTLRIEIAAGGGRRPGMGILDGRAAVVTGGGRGIGRGHCLHLARQGAAVVVNDVDANEARAVAAEL